MSKVTTLTQLENAGIIGPAVRLQSRYSLPAIEDVSTAFAQALNMPEISFIVLELGLGGAGNLSDAIETDPGVVARVTELCGHLENSPKPVIATLAGHVRGGAAALALASHYRIASPDAVMDFPAVRIGLVPGMGVTQRLPRLCGAAESANMLITGLSRDAAALANLGIVDLVVDVDLQSAAQNFITTDPVSQPRPTALCREGLSDGVSFHKEISTLRAKAVAQLGQPVLSSIVDCIEAAALLPFASGVLFEQTALEDATRSPVARALRHVLKSEHQAVEHIQSQMADSFNGVKRVALYRLGAETAEIASMLLMAGIGVTLWDQNATVLEKVLSHTGDLLEGLHTRGAMDADTYSACVQALEVSLEDKEPADTQVVLLGRTTDIPATVRKSDTLVAVRLNHVEGESGLMLGAPFSNGSIAEIIAPKDFSPDHLAVLFALSARMTRLPIWTQGQGTGVLGYMTDATLTIAEGLFAMGVTPYAIDAALKEGGFKRGLLETLDDQGISIHKARRQGFCKPGSIELLCAADRFGKPHGAGFYRYEGEGKTPSEDPEVIGLLAQMIPEITADNPGGLTPKDIQEIFLAGLVNIGCHLIRTGQVSSALDLDALMVHGLDYPRINGGPMFAAQEMGHLVVRRILLSMTEATGNLFWEIDPLLDSLIKNGENFADYRAEETA
ncbi:MAG: enoyl-CoA hydratase-related protein [Pseudoruegeria sp.]